MASSRLTDPQKQELVGRYSRGEASVALAEAYGVSANTVSRIVKAALPPELYESLKQQRARGAAAPQAAATPEPKASVPGSTAPTEPADLEAALTDLSPSSVIASSDASESETASAGAAQNERARTGARGVSRSRRRSSAGVEAIPAAAATAAAASQSSIALQALDQPRGDHATGPAAPSPHLITDRDSADRDTADQSAADLGVDPVLAGHNSPDIDARTTAAGAPGPEDTRPARPVARRSAAAAALSSRPDPRADSDPGVLAIDDADDFADDLADDDFDASDDGADGMDPFTPIAVSLNAIGGAIDGVMGGGNEAVTCRPLTAASFNGGVYMLVDKTVELQPRPLREFSELGALPAEEADRQAISLFINPREAKRQCGRSQRVIKMPDPRLLERTAPFLLAQGISRVVVEGALYALPGS